jgi:oligopeptide transport system ATP-binding protein
VSHGDPSPLLAVRHLRKTFRTRHGTVTAVESVDFDLDVGETLAIVGESGCGKSTLAMALLGLIQVDDGTVSVDGGSFAPVAQLRSKLLSHHVGVVFQNPHSSLNPKMRVQSIVGEPLLTALGMRGPSRRDRVLQCLRDVGLGIEHMRRYPHELSGGQLQRVAIARALALQPRLIVLDEPTAALDVCVQAQILRLLKDLQQKSRVSYLFISHDFGAVNFLADRIGVMYLGGIVESGPAAQILLSPKHPYTRALIDAIPTIHASRRGRFEALPGEVPSALRRPQGCPFSPRCRWSQSTCRSTAPSLESAGAGRKVACHFPLVQGPPLAGRGVGEDPTFAAEWSRSHNRERVGH